MASKKHRHLVLLPATILTLLQLFPFSNASLCISSKYNKRTIVIWSAVLWSCAHSRYVWLGVIRIGDPHCRVTPTHYKYLFFKVCKSVHHRTVQINHQPDATIFQFIILNFIYSSICFGRFPAHHQELNDCSSSL